MMPDPRPTGERPNRRHGFRSCPLLLATLPPLMNWPTRMHWPPRMHWTLLAMLPLLVTLAAARPLDGQELLFPATPPVHKAGLREVAGEPDLALQPDLAGEPNAAGEPDLAGELDSAGEPDLAGELDSAGELIPAGEPDPADGSGPIELAHGMPRRHVLELLGEPEMESLIGVLGRSRATYPNGAELLFERESLIGVKSPRPAEPTGDGRLSFALDRTTVVYDEELALPPPAVLPRGDERRVVTDSFYFAPGANGSDGFDIHLTPSARVCVLNDCPGCDACGQPAAGPHDVPSTLFGSGSPLCGPTWQLFRVSADAIFLSRLGSDFTLPLLDGGLSTETERLTHGMTAGFQGEVTLHLHDGQHLEFGYLGGFDWSSRGSSENLVSPVDGVLSWNGTYDASLNDYQINYLHRGWDSAWSLLCGIRYSEHADAFTAEFAGQIAGPPPVDRHPLAASGRARNRLLGVQVGTAGEWNCGPFILYASIKGGVFNNETRQTGPAYSGAIDLGANPVALPRFQREGQEVSLMGDFEFTVLYPIAEPLAIRVGYQGLVFSEMVQARRQFGSPASGSALNYHGIFVGLEIRQ